MGTGIDIGVGASIATSLMFGVGMEVGVGVGVGIGVEVVLGVDIFVAVAVGMEGEVTIDVGVELRGCSGLDSGSGDWGVAVAWGVSTAPWTDVEAEVGGGSEEQDRTASEHIRRVRRDRTGPFISASGCSFLSRLLFSITANSLLGSTDVAPEKVRIMAAATGFGAGSPQSLDV